MEANYLKELLVLLRDKNPIVRQTAVNTLAGYTPRESKFRYIFLEGLNESSGQDTQVTRDLKILCRDQPVSLAVMFILLIEIISRNRKQHMMHFAALSTYRILRC